MNDSEKFWSMSEDILSLQREIEKYKGRLEVCQMLSGVKLENIDPKDVLQNIIQTHKRDILKADRWRTNYIEMLENTVISGLEEIEQLKNVIKTLENK